MDILARSQGDHLVLFTLNKMDEYESAANVDYSSLPLAERLTHKNWKARLDAYDELSRLFARASSPNASIFREHAETVRKLPCESHAAAQESALACLLVFVAEAAPDATIRIRSAVVQAIVERALAAARPGTRNKSLDALMSMIEVDTAEPVITELIELAKHKTPKLAAAAINASTAILRAFGTPAVNAKNLVQILAAAFNHADKTVRSEATCLAVELYRWLGANSSGLLLDGLKPVQIKALQEQFSAIGDPAALPTRWLRSQKAQESIRSPISAADLHPEADASKVEASIATIDHYECAAPVRILDRLPADFYTHLESQKWKERKEAVEALLPVVKVVRLEEGHYGELVSALVKRVSDANVMVVIAAASCLEALANGLRASFHQHRALAIPALLDRTKEKKQSVIDALRGALDATLWSGNELASILEDCAPFIGHKNPQIKSETLLFLSRALARIRSSATSKRDAKAICDLAIPATEDGANEVREAAAELLATLLTIAGEKTAMPFMDKIDKTRMAKIQEIVAKLANRDGGRSNAPAASIAPVPAASIGRPTADGASVSAPATRNAGVSLPRKEELPAAPAAKPGHSQRQADCTVAAVPSEDMELSDTSPPPAPSSVADELIPRTDITAQITSDLLSQLCDSNWKERKEALDQLARILDSANQRIRLANGEVFAALKARLADSNKILVIQSLGLIGLFADSLGGGSEKHLKSIMSEIYACFNDNKIQVRQAVTKTLDAALKVSSLSIFVAPAASSLAIESPHLRREILLWLSTAVLANEISTDELQELVVAVLPCLLDRSAEVRKAAQTMVEALASIFGTESVKKACNGQKPALVSAALPYMGSSKAPAAVKKQAPIPSHAPARTAPSTPRRMQKSAPGVETPGRLVRSSSSISISAQPSTPVFPILDANATAKSLRADRDKGLAKWQFETPRKDLVETLQEQMKEHFSDQLVARLFSDDFRDHMAGLTMLQDVLSSQHASLADANERFLANLDLILKYLTIRFFDTNTTVFLKCLDLIEQAIAMADASGYRMLDYEASSFLPYFIGKVGDNKETMRQRVRVIFKQICRIYPASKLFAFFIDGIKSKNARTRSECLEEMAFLLSRNGLSVVQPSKHLPLIAAQAIDRDAAVRNGALNVLVQAYSFMGEALLKHLSGMGTKEMGMFEERLKRSKNPVDGSKAAEETALPDRPSVVEVFDAPQAQYSLEPPSVALFMPPVPPLPATSSLFDIATPALPTRYITPPTLATLDDPLEQLIIQIRNTADLSCIDCLRRLDEYLITPKPGVYAHANSLVKALCVRVHDCAVDRDEPDLALKSRLCRYVANALVLLLSDSGLASRLDDDAVQPLICETLTGLLCEKVQSFGDREQLHKAFNSILVRALEGAKPVICYRVLVRKLAQEFQQPPPAGARLPEMTMKCLWKMTKQLRERVEAGAIEIDQLLLVVHNFLVALPPVEWKVRAGRKLPFEDLPLRTVKTILHELVLALDSNVLMFLGSLENPENSFVTSYLHAMIAAVASEANSQEKDLRVARLTSEAIEAALQEICSKICTKPETRIGLCELYQFRRLHSYALAQIDAFLVRLGPFFHKYIERGLARLDVEHGQSQSSGGEPSLTADDPVDAFKNRLVQMQRQVFGSNVPSHQGSTIASLVASAPPSNSNSPITPRTGSRLREWMESPNRVDSPKRSAELGLSKDASMVSLKERLAKLRGQQANPTN